MADTERLGVEITLDTDDLEKGVKKAKEGISDLAKEAKQGSNALDGLGSSASRSGKGFDDNRTHVQRLRDSFKDLRNQLRNPMQAKVMLKDKATEGVRKVKRELDSFKGKAYTAMINVKTNGAESIAGLKQSMKSTLMGAPMALAAGAGFTFGIGDAIKDYADFESQMSAVKAISGATDEEFKKLNETAVKMGADTKFSALESAQAFQYMGMAGWKTEDMINGIGGIMSLAAASGEDLAMVSDVVTDSLTAFGLQAKDSAMFADVLAAAATNSNTNVGMMGYTFKYAAPLAGALGYTVQDLSTAIGLMANAGIKGEQAGTSLRSIMTRMASPTKDSADAMATLGVKLTDASGKMRPFKAIMQDMRKGFQGMTEAEKAQTAAALAGQEGMSGLLAIVNASEGDFNKLTEAINNSTGAADKMAKTRMDNFAGDLEYLSGDFDALKMDIMSSKIGNLRSIVQGADKVLGDFAESVKTNGLGVRSIFDGITSAVMRLVNEVKELNGSGSALAALTLGAGAFGAYKLGKKGLGLFKSKVPGMGGDGGSDTVNDMTVNAMNVTLNAAKLLPGTEALPGGKGGPSPTDALPPVASKGAGMMAKIGKYAKWGGRLAGGLAVASSIYNVATADDKDKVKVAGQEGSGLVGMAAGAKAGAMAGGAIGAAFGGVGAAPGAAIGGLIGGAVGYLGGTKLGEMVDWDGLVADGGKAVDSIKTMWDGGMQALGDGWHTVVDSGSSAMDVVESTWDSGMTSLGNAWDSAKTSASNMWDQLVDGAKTTAMEIATPYINVFNTIVGAGAMVWDLIKPYWNAVATWMDTTVWQPIKNFATSVWNSLVMMATNAWNGIVSVWTTVSTWFDTAVWQPLQALATLAWNGIVTAISDAWNWISSIWGMVTAWFDGFVWQPLTAAASTAWSEVVNFVSNAWSGLVGIWGVAASWFDSTVWSPIKNAVSSVGTAIINAFDGAINAVKGTWGGVVGWFENTIINPLSNAFAKLGQMASDAKTRGEGITGIVPEPEQHAVGATHFSGGWTEINERGGEIVDLPSGSRIYPHATTQRMLKQELGSSNGGSANVNISGNTFVVREEADIDRIAHQIMKLFTQAQSNYGGGY